jgi:hypothetical protein
MIKTLRNFIVILVIAELWSCAAKKELKTPPPGIAEPELPAGTLLWVIKPSINIRQENSAG